MLAPPAAFLAASQQPDALLLDVRDPELRAGGHLPGAIGLPYASYVTPRPPAMGCLPALDTLAHVLGAVGYAPDRLVLACDEGGSGKAARLLWTLAALGHTRMALLDGGLAALQNETTTLLTQTPTPVQPSAPQFAWAEGIVADRDWVLAHLCDPDVLLLDTRSAGEYAGFDVRAARGGHIPGAVHLDWSTAFDPGRLPRTKPLEHLRAQLLAAGVVPEREIVVYCQTHHRSAHSWVVLKTLGYPRVRGYAGAWSEWGNTPGMPIEP